MPDMRCLEGKSVVIGLLRMPVDELRRNLVALGATVLSEATQDVQFITAELSGGDIYKVRPRVRP
jgi:hypothetical protein